MKRRDFINLSLSSVGTLGLSSLFPLHKVLALSAQDFLKHQVIMIRIPGGWDTSLCMDPWTADQRLPESEYFIEYRKDQLLKIGERFFGPSMAPLKDYLPRATVINGLFLSRRDNGHDAATLYVETGNGEGHLGSFGIELEGIALNSAMGLMINTNVTMGHRMTSVWDANRVLANGKVSPADTIFNDEPGGSFIDLAKNALINNGDRIAKFNSLLAEDVKKGGLKIHSVIAAGFSAGLTQSAAIGIPKFLDTHSNHPQSHNETLTSAFEDVKALLDSLRATPSFYDTQKSLLDSTTVIVTSEFTRTPALNASLGKDHNPQCNSMLIFSPLLKAATVGASHIVTQSKSSTGRPLLASTPLHRKTFMPMEERPDTFLLRPENIYGTLLTAMGVNPAKISPEFEESLVLKPILR